MFFFSAALLPQQDGPTFHSAFLPASCAAQSQGGAAEGGNANTISGSLPANGQAGERKLGGTKPGNLFHQDTPSVALDSSGLNPVVAGPASSASSSSAATAAAAAAQLA